MNTKNKSLYNIVLSALFLAIGLILPFFTLQIKQIGNMLLPLHLPVMLCGLVCSWRYGLLVGASLPILRSLIFGMPMLYPSALAMAFECATYGLIIGFLFEKIKTKSFFTLYLSMIIAMIAGRAVWGVVMTMLLGLKDMTFTFYAFFVGAFANAVPGIILQLILIPLIMLMLGKIPAVKFRILKESKEKEKTYE